MGKRAFLLPLGRGYAKFVPVTSWGLYRTTGIGILTHPDHNPSEQAYKPGLTLIFAQHFSDTLPGVFPLDSLKENGWGDLEELCEPLNMAGCKLAFAG